MDGLIKGYLSDQDNAKMAVLEVAKRLVHNKRESSEEIRVFTEHIDGGINIYTQTLGTYFNGPVTLLHTIEYKNIPEFDINFIE